MRDVTKAAASQTMASRWWGVPACAKGHRIIEQTSLISAAALLLNA